MYVYLCDTDTSIWILEAMSSDTYRTRVSDTHIRHDTSI